jgi:hypothetical protein
MKHLSLFSRRGLHSLIATVPFGVMGLLATDAQAQVSAAGCSAGQSGVFNQTVGTGGSGTTVTRTLAFASGGTITVTIVGASNSLFDITGVTTLFSGETGNQTRSHTFTSATTATVSADIRAGGTGPAGISATCSSATSGSSTGTTSTPAVTPTPESGRSKTVGPSAEDKAVVVDSGSDALDRGRPSTSPAALPDFLEYKERKAIERIVEARVDAARIREEREDEIHSNANDLGIPDGVHNFALQLALSQFYQDTQNGMPVQQAEDILAERVYRLAQDVPVDARDPKYTDESLRKGVSRAIASHAGFIAIANGRAAFTVANEVQLSPEGQSALDRALTTSVESALANNFVMSTQSRGLDNFGNTQLWARGAFSRLGGAGDRDGRTSNLMLGFVHRLENNVNVGGFVSFLNGHTTQATPATRLETKGFGFGAYTKFDLGRDLRGGLSVFHERSDNDTTIAGATGSYDRRYSTIDAEISRTFDTAGWTLTPSARIGYVMSDRDGYTDSTGTVVAGRKDSYTSASAALGFSRGVEAQFGARSLDMTIFGTLAIDYWDIKDRVLTTGQKFAAGGTSGRVSLGTNFDFTNGDSFSVELGKSGLGTDTNAVTARISYALNF